MTAVIRRHVLAGCAPTPLAGYLKALGVLRVVAEQADPAARGQWQDERFVLLTRLDEQALIEFFLRDWSPGAWVSPWNKGSGLAGRDPKGVDPLLASVAPRFETARQGIGQARGVMGEFAQAVADEKAIKDEANRIKDKVAREALKTDPAYEQRLAAASRRCKRLKDFLQPECQRVWRGSALRWLRAALVIEADDRAAFPSLLGTGGNDGKLDFTNNAMQRLGALFDLASAAGDPRPGAAEALRSALFGATERALIKGSIGQFSPADAGGANASAGALAASLTNPWDLPLALEGAVLFTAGISRRLGAAGSRSTVAPFSTRSWAAGYASAAAADEGSRGEQWMPLWSRPWTAGEVLALLAEGRSQIGARPVDSALDMARAVSRLGVARGVVAFERYAYIERNGKSNYAVPIGRWEVRASPTANLLDDLEQGQWLTTLRRATRDKNAPASLARAERWLADAILAALAHGDEPRRWQEVLIALARLEAQLVQSGAFTVKRRLRPIPHLSPAWIEAAGDGGPELRLALALASAGAPGAARDPVRVHWLPLSRTGGFAGGERGLARDPRVVMSGRDAEDDLVRLVQRRLVEAGSGTRRSLPLHAPAPLCARVDDIMALVLGRVDLERTLWLARALAASGPLRPAPATGAQASFAHAIDPAWAVLRLCHLPWAFGPGRATIPADPAILRLLAAGDADRALAVALRRLRAAGVHAALRFATLDPAIARRYAASLAFPVSAYTAGRLAGFLDPTNAPTVQEPAHVG